MPPPPPSRPNPPPTWRLPEGVTRGLWDYLHDEAIARDSEARLAGTALLEVDCRFVARHCGKPGRVIDLGCGAGRMVAPLAALGHRVVGVDLSEPMLRVAGAKAAAAGLTLGRIKANLVELDALADGAFDHALCLFSTLGMVAGAAARRRVLSHGLRLLRPGGTLILHVHNRWFNGWDPSGRRWLARNFLAALLGREPAGDRIMPPHSGGAGWPMHLFTRREIRRLLRAAGFRIMEVEPMSLRPDGRVVCPWWFGGLRAYGYLIAAHKPAG